MTEQINQNVSKPLSAEDQAFLETNSLNDVKHLAQELSDIGEDTTCMSSLIIELEGVYHQFYDEDGSEALADE